MYIQSIQHSLCVCVCVVCVCVCVCVCVPCRPAREWSGLLPKTMSSVAREAGTTEPCQNRLAMCQQCVNLQCVLLCVNRDLDCIKRGLEYDKLACESISLVKRDEVGRVKRDLVNVKGEPVKKADCRV